MYILFTTFPHSSLSFVRLLGSQQQKAIESRIQAQLTATQQLFRTLRPVTGDVATSEKNISVTIQSECCKSVPLTFFVNLINESFFFFVNSIPLVLPPHPADWQIRGLACTMVPTCKTPCPPPLFYVQPIALVGGWS